MTCTYAECRMTNRKNKWDIVKWAFAKQAYVNGNPCRVLIDQVLLLRNPQIDILWHGMDERTRRHAYVDGDFILKPVKSRKNGVVENTNWVERKKKKGC